jgi:hypothetical protein
VIHGPLGLDRALPYQLSAHAHQLTTLVLNLLLNLLLRHALYTDHLAMTEHHHISEHAWYSIYYCCASTNVAHAHQLTTLVLNLLLNLLLRHALYTDHLAMTEHHHISEHAWYSIYYCCASTNVQTPPRM